MLIYFILYLSIALIVVLFDLLCIKSEHKNKYISLSIFILIFLLFALRHQSMGVDLNYLSSTGYLGSFDELSSYSWREVLQIDKFQNYEKGYIIFNKLIGSITKSRQIFMAVVAFISIFPVYRLIRKRSTSSGFSYVIYMGIPLFTLLFSGIRQSIAIGFCAYAYIFITEKKLIKFILAVLFASVFHVTALVFLVAYPLYYIRINNKLRFYSVISIPIIYLLRHKIFDFVIRFSDKIIEVDNNNSFVLLVVFALIYMFAVAMSNKENGQNGFLNIFYVACLCQTLGGVSSVIVRLGYYFLLSIIILLPNVIERIRDEQTKGIVKVVTFYCFAVFGIFNLYTTSWAMANPYIFFWN